MRTQSVSVAHRTRTSGAKGCCEEDDANHSSRQSSRRKAPWIRLSLDTCRQQDETYLFKHTAMRGRVPESQSGVRDALRIALRVLCQHRIGLVT